MPTPERLAEQFEELRPHVRAVAYRMLGSVSEAQDAVQETWIRLSRPDVSGVDNLRGWLTTVVARVCLDMLRTRASRREDPLDMHVPDPIIRAIGRGDEGPETDAMIADSVGLALLVVLEKLEPAERLAFVLHDGVVQSGRPGEWQDWPRVAPSGRARAFRDRLHDCGRQGCRDGHPGRSRPAQSARSVGHRALTVGGRHIGAGGSVILARRHVMDLQATEQTIAAPRPVTMPRLRTIIYWVVSAPVLLETAVGAEWDFARIPFVREIFAHLGYPLYLLTILGIAKVLAVIGLVTPRARA